MYGKKHFSARELERMPHPKGSLPRRFFDSFLSGQLPFRVRLFNVLATGGMLAGLIMGTINTINGGGLVSIITGICSASLSFALLYYAYKSGRYQICYMITITAIFMGYFPSLFFRMGGYHGGKIAFFIFAVVYTAYMLEGKTAWIVIAVELLVYTGVFVYAYINPASVTVLPSELGYLRDAISNFLFVSIALSITLVVHLNMYNRQQRELEAARKQAEEYARMKSELFADMSHEMRTPLTVMSAYAQYAVERLQLTGPNEQTLADLSTISDEAKRLAEMADGTLKILLSSDKSGKRENAPVDIGILAAQLIRLFGAIVSRKGRGLTADIQENLPAVYGDMDALTQLFWNILQNAVTHSEGDIELLAVSDGQSLSVQVKDNGAGIPPALLPRIFERGVSGVKNGSGIGLSLCRDIARQHGGDVVAESSPGTGTCITVTLPAIKEEKADG
jgi:signal transduction histidine kinase